jgi:hypothetical protein
VEREREEERKGYRSTCSFSGQELKLKLKLFASDALDTDG